MYAFLVPTVCSADLWGTPRSTNTHPDKALVEDAYDAIAPKYLAWSAPRPTETRKLYIDRLAASLPAGARVLELGCGAGVPATQQLLEHGLNVTGTDISQAQIDLAKEHCPGGTFIKEDMVALVFEPESFDAVCSFYAIWHLPVEDQAEIMMKMKGWVKKGGKLLLNLQTEKGEHWIKDWMGHPMYSCGAGIEANRKMVEQEGFRIEEEIASEQVGRFTEKFQWFLITKE